MNEFTENVAVEVETTEVPETDLVEETYDVEETSDYEANEPSDYDEDYSCDDIPDTNIGGGLLSVAGRVASHTAAFGAGVAVGRVSAKVLPPKPKKEKKPGVLKKIATSTKEIIKDSREEKKARKQERKALKEAAKTEVNDKEEK